MAYVETSGSSGLHTLDNAHAVLRCHSRPELIQAILFASFASRFGIIRQVYTIASTSVVLRSLRQKDRYQNVQKIHYN
jgi:hypothetical protein